MWTRPRSHGTCVGVCVRWTELRVENPPDSSALLRCWGGARAPPLSVVWPPTSYFISWCLSYEMVLSHYLLGWG